LNVGSKSFLEIDGSLIYSRFARSPFAVSPKSIKVFLMIRLVGLVLIIVCAAASAWSQGKGIDKTSERVRDAGTAGSNAPKTNTGAGPGIDFGKGKTHEVLPLPNPYRLSARRDVILSAIANVMRDRKLIMDDAASKPSEGIIVSQPYTFIKGAVVSQSELGRYAILPPSSARGWTRGRYTITVEVQSIDGNSANVSVNAKIEGRTDGATGAEWATLPTSGVVEDEFLSALISAVTGGPPPGRVE
jgi:hypothetical protein